jgi:hypothetical protein
MSNWKYVKIKTNFANLLRYSEECGKYGLLKDGCIREIKGYSYTITPQELHFDKPFLKRLFTIFKGSFAYTRDFISFSDSKKVLRKHRRYLKKIGYIK